MGMNISRVPTARVWHWDPARERLQKTKIEGATQKEVAATEFLNRHRITLTGGSLLGRNDILDRISDVLMQQGEAAAPQALDNMRFYPLHPALDCNYHVVLKPVEDGTLRAKGFEYMLKAESWRAY